MSLLNEVVRNPLEPEYALAAGRARGSVPARGSWLVLAVLLGVLTTAAVLALRVPDPGALEARALLTDEIVTRTEESDALREETERLSAEIAELQVQAAATRDPELLAELGRDEVAAGVVAVAGPGLSITLTDGPGSEEGRPDPDARVQDIDLQILVNGLWAAGAEGVAINGHRLTALSAIRSAGEAVLVDLSPLVPPYVVEAVGDGRALQTELARQPAGRHLLLLQSTYGIVAELALREEVVLPGATVPVLRYAELVPEDDGTAQDPGAVEQTAGLVGVGADDRRERSQRRATGVRGPAGVASSCDRVTTRRRRRQL